MKKIYNLFLIILLFALQNASAQNNIAPYATASASTCNTGACSTLNDLNYGSCGTQQMWISTGTPPSTTPGVEYLQFDWPGNVSFNAFTIHHAQTGTRFLAGALVQIWDASINNWNSIYTFSNLNNANCSNVVALPGIVTTSKLRLTSFQASGSQLSNMNFREIEIWEAIPPPVNITPPSPNFQFTLGVDMLWEKSVSNIINTSTGADKSYWNISQYSSVSATGPWTNYSTLPKDTPQCNAWGCFIDTARNNPNLFYNFPNRGFYKVSLTTVNINGVASIEKIVQVDTPKVKPTAMFFATRRTIGNFDQIQINNLSTNAPATAKWWVEKTCSNCPADSNRFLPNDQTFNPVFAAYTPGVYKMCVAVSNSKGSDTFCRNDYMTVLPGYLMYHSEPGRYDSVGTSASGFIYSDLRSSTGVNYSGQYVPSSGTNGFRIAPCADTIYLALDRLRLRPGTFASQGDSLYIRLNGFSGPIVRRYGGNSISTLKDSVKVFKYAGQNLFVTFSLMPASPQPATVPDSGFAIYWRSSPANYGMPTAGFTNPDTLYSGYTVRFMNSSVGSRMFFSWDLNNDSIFGLEKPSVKVDSITVNPTYTFTTTSNTFRKVCLKANNCVGTSLLCKNIPLVPIVSPPSANFIVDKTVGFLSDTFQFTDKTSFGSLAWKWRFEPNNVTWLAGTDSTSQNPLISLNSAQTYNVTLIASNPFGSSQITRNQLVSGIDYGSPGTGFDASLDVSDFGISRVVIAGADKVLDTVTPLKSPTYTRLNTDMKTTVYRGGTYNIDVYRITANDSMTLRVWADFNRDADYTDENETILSEDKQLKVKTSVAFTVPGNASIGGSRILIGACNSISSISSISANVGVYEDYGMFIGNDLVKPIITLNGNAIMMAELGKTYADPGATAIDNIEGNISTKIQVISNLNTGILGFYKIQYFVIDLYGNVSDTLTRSVQVVMNNSGPSLVLNGSDSMTVEVFSSYTEPGYVAKDNLGNDISAMVTRTGEVYNTVLGTYVLTYAIKDAFGLTVQKTRRVLVVDTQKPVIATFTGASNIVHQIGKAFDDYKYVQVLDNYDADLPVTRSGQINITKAGTYLLKYDAVDHSGNIALSFNLSVKVTNSIPPVINLVGAADMIVPVYSTYNELGVVATDYKGELLPYESDLNLKLRMDTINTVEITYIVTDEFGLSAQAKRVIRVMDVESPVIELLGANPFSSPLCKDYVDPGVKVTDNFNATQLVTATKNDNIGIQVTIDYSKVNTCGAGFYYTVYINAKDASGNKAEERKRAVYIPLTGIEDLNYNKGFKLFPNPANQVLNIDLKASEIESVLVYDVQGKLTNVSSSASGNSYKLDVSGLNSGIYFINIVTTDGKILNGKFNVSR